MYLLRRKRNDTLFLTFSKRQSSLSEGRADVPVEGVTIRGKVTALAPTFPHPHPGPPLEGECFTGWKQDAEHFGYEDTPC